MRVGSAAACINGTVYVGVNHQLMRSYIPGGLQILGYINPWLTHKGPGATCTVAREVLDVFMGLLLMSNRISQANRCVGGGLWGHFWG